MPIGPSLHIGLNAVDPKQYSGWDGQLTACEFDANDMQALAKAQGFTKITKRLTKRATRSRVLADIKAARQLGAAGIVVFSYDTLITPPRGSSYLSQLGKAAFTAPF